MIESINKQCISRDLHNAGGDSEASEALELTSRHEERLFHEGNVFLTTSFSNFTHATVFFRGEDGFVDFLAQIIRVLLLKSITLMTRKDGQSTM